MTHQVVNDSFERPSVEWSHYDLPIALRLLAAMGLIDSEMLSGFLVVGELGLDGRVAPVPGVLLAALHAAANDLGLICPAAQGGEAAWAGEVDVIAAPDRLTLINHLTGTQLRRCAASPRSYAPAPTWARSRGRRPPSARLRSPPPAGTTC